MRTSEERRAEYLPAAKLLFTAAHMQGILEDLPNKDVSGAMLNQAYGIAVSITAMYENLYQETDRHYHTLQHPRIQLLDQEGSEMLGMAYNKSLPPNKDAVADVAQIPLSARNMARGVYADPISEEETPDKNYISALAQRIPPELAETLRQQDRHDCIYYFVESRSPQHNWLHPFKEKSSTTQQIIEEGGQEHNPFHFAEPLPFADVQVSIGELAAIALFPKEQGEYDKEKTFVASGGLNEWASAVYAIIEENKRRTTEGFPPISARETLQTCATIAATIPFQAAGSLDKMADNLYKFLAKEEQLPLRNALGVADDDTLRGLIDAAVQKAGKFANRDVGNFAASDVGDLYCGDRTVAAENKGLSLQTDNLIHQYRLSCSMLDQHAEEPLRQTLDSGVSGAGFIRSKAIAGTIYHDFKAALSRNPHYCLTEAEEKHAIYLYNVESVIALHKRDVTFFGLQLISELTGKPFDYTAKEQITPEMSHKFFEGPSALATKIVTLIKDTDDVENIKMLKSQQVSILGEQAEKIFRPSVSLAPPL